MNVVMSYCVKDYNLAFYALRVMLDKTNVPVARLYAHGSNSAPPLPPDLQAAGITYIKCMNKDGEHPIGPNTMFAAILHYFAAKGYDGP